MKETELQPPDQGTSEPRHFWCFISYRHADNKEQGRQWATWLHHSIETYEVPRDLIGKQNERGDVIPERIYPVFRDEVELPADARLSKPIQGALERSRFLLVLSSPRARESRFVNEEIVFFQQHKAENRDRVLAAILAGDPGALDEDLGEQGSLPDSRRQCFPDPLRFEMGREGERTGIASEPVAADFRLDDGKEGYTNSTALRDALVESGLDRSTIAARVAAYEKRQELMLLKIIAGILGVQLGELARRDKAHQLQKIRARNRILTAAAVVFAGLAALAGWLGFVATQRGEEAKRETARAEDRERAAIRQNAHTLLVQGTRALAEQDVRGVCHLVESLKLCPEDNPALAALLTTLHFRRWAWR